MQRPWIPHDPANIPPSPSRVHLFTQDCHHSGATAQTTSHLVPRHSPKWSPTAGPMFEPSAWLCSPVFLPSGYQGGPPVHSTKPVLTRERQTPLKRPWSGDESSLVPVSSSATLCWALSVCPLCPEHLPMVYTGELPSCLQFHLTLRPSLAPCFTVPPFGCLLTAAVTH